MEATLTIHVRAFPVIVREGYTGAEREELVVLDKARLQAAQLMGQSSKELITRLCAQDGFDVIRIGKARKQTIDVDLEELYSLHTVYPYRPKSKAERKVRA